MTNDPHRWSWHSWVPGFEQKLGTDERRVIADVLKRFGETGPDGINEPDIDARRRIIVDIAARLRRGFETYGALDIANDQRDWVREEYEEQLDGWVYRSIARIKAATADAPNVRDHRAAPVRFEAAGGFVVPARDPRVFVDHFVESGTKLAEALDDHPKWGPRMREVKARREAERAAELAANRADFLRDDHERHWTRVELLERMEALAADHDAEDFRQACWLMRFHGVKP